MATAQMTYTTTEAGVELGVTPTRVRQYCIAYDEIGRKHGRDWSLTEADILRIRNLPEFRKKPTTDLEG